MGAFEPQRGPRDLGVHLDDFEHAVADLGDLADGVHGRFDAAIGQLGLVSNVGERRAEIVEDCGRQVLGLLDAPLLEAEEMVKCLGEGDELVEVADGSVSFCLRGGDKRANLPGHVRKWPGDGSIETQKQIDRRHQADDFRESGEDDDAPERPDPRVGGFSDQIASAGHHRDAGHEQHEDDEDRNDSPHEQGEERVAAESVPELPSPGHSRNP